MACPLAIVEANLLRPAIVIKTTIRAKIEVEMATGRNVGEGDNVPREASGIRVDLATLAACSSCIVDKLDLLEIRRISIARNGVDGTGARCIGCELYNGTRSGRGRWACNSCSIRNSAIDRIDGGDLSKLADVSNQILSWRDLLSS